MTRRTESSDPTPGGMLDELMIMLSGVGIVFMTFLGAIPGLLPVVALVVVPGILLLIPLLVATVVLAVVAGPFVLLARMIRRMASQGDALRAEPARGG